MNIQKYIKECYEIAQSKGFYPEDSKIEDHLMGIVSEIGEAYEAHRGGKFAPLTKKGLPLILEQNPKSIASLEWYYKENYSGTFEDELADIFIRLFNLCGHYKLIPVLPSGLIVSKYKNISEVLFWATRILSQIDTRTIDIETLAQISDTFQILDYICDYENIPIEKHIQAKIEYNKTREHLHGKKY